MIISQACEASLCDHQARAHQVGFHTPQHVAAWRCKQSLKSICKRPSAEHARPKSRAHAQHDGQWLAKDAGCIPRSEGHGAHVSSAYIPHTACSIQTHRQHHHDHAHSRSPGVTLAQTLWALLVQVLLRGLLQSLRCRIESIIGLLAGMLIPII